MAKAKKKGDKFANYRKKTVTQRGSYRPNLWEASVAEAREIFKARYAKRGFKVKSVRRRASNFTVTFGEDANGLGLGPFGLKNVLCNWPYINDIPLFDEAQKFIEKRDGIK